LFAPAGLPATPDGETENDDDGQGGEEGTTVAAEKFKHGFRAFRKGVETGAQVSRWLQMGKWKNATLARHQQTAGTDDIPAMVRFGFHLPAHSMAMADGWQARGHPIHSGHMAPNV
jgi:hypothetical protein